MKSYLFFINKIQKFVRHQIVFDEAFFALFYKCFERFHVAFLLSLSRNILSYPRLKFYQQIDCFMGEYDNVKKL